MVQLLLQDNRASSEEEDEAGDTELSPEEERVLVAIFCAAIERATGHLIMPGRRKPQPGPVQKQQHMADSEAFTIAVMKELPRLLQKVGCC